MQRRGFHPPLSLRKRGFFPWVLTPFPTTISDECINRGPVCARMHSITRTQKVLTFMFLTGECQQEKHTQHAPSTKMECDCLYSWIKKNGHTLENLTTTIEGEPQRYSWERRRRTSRRRFRQKRNLSYVLSVTMKSTKRLFCTHNIVVCLVWLIV